MCCQIQTFLKVGTSTVFSTWQVADYANRKGVSKESVETWLSPILSYER